MGWGGSAMSQRKRLKYTVVDQSRLRDADAIKDALDKARDQGQPVLLSDALLIEMLKVKDSYNVGMIDQLVARSALEDQAWMRANVDRVRTTRERVFAELTATGFTVLPSEANFLFIRPPQTKPAAQLMAVLREHRILVRYFPGERTGQYIRVTIGTDKQMDRFLAVLREVCGQ